MKQKLVFEENEKLMPLSREEMQKRKLKMEKTLEKSSKIKVFYRPDMEKLSMKLKKIYKEYDQEKIKKRIVVLNIEKSKFFK